MGSKQIHRITSLAIVTVIMSAIVTLAPDSARATVVGVKMNWDIGANMINGTDSIALTYHDAHIVIASKGAITDPPTKIINGDFGAGGSSSKVVNAAPGVDDTLTVDWSSKAGVSGPTHIGVDFNLNNLNQRTDIRVISATLTDVVGVGSHSGFQGPSIPIPGPPSIQVGKSNSAAVTLGVSDPALISPVTFSKVAFYKTGVEPPIEALTAAAFPGLPKTFLMAVPDFALATGGTSDIEVPGINPPEWLLASYTTSWTDPTLSAMLGNPIVVSVDTWFATQLVPEPSTIGLGLSAAALVIPWALRRRRR